ncbi:MAG: MBL fold metallo-hydrolase [Lentimicrobiaceae bacterium]|jgi:glyoxylase-like metal-dependent hydrolase (beta-lactamase superfamily II)|nr:MBL fold metallo-hydrolase [Lentimicrobiaceae bacterium]MCP4911329.1 MBL fold metallo-hydrolase [Bacteroidota bacterium]MBT3454059.1 MBL fold metallo-hydrolase [Lentimicrobiaceae bacterium]MBT3819177.1 MBL fold metallo-hydrolase [Lentimicrobiaceae bacterium]MBT4060606.1 MBL fold metallo-hydrolase [Lentimicrobiaceae bacterium]
MKLYPIETGNLKLDGGAMFGVVPKVMWSKVYPADENNLCNWSMRCLLIKDENRIILIDNGIGNKQDEKWLRHYYLNGEDTLEKSLKNIGVTPEDITDVIITHMHFDHCGGSVKWNDDKTGYELSFPNATYWTSRKQYELAVNPNRREKASFLKENIQPVEESGKLKLIDKEGEYIPNITFKMYYGHTDGQLIPHIFTGNKTVVFMADLLPSTAHIPMPWIMAYDTRPLQTLKDKERFYSEAIKNNYVLFFEHDLHNEACTLKDTEKGIRADQIGRLEELV